MERSDRTSENRANRLLAAVLLTGLALVGAEVGVRLEEAIRYGVPLGSNRTAVDQLAVRDSLGRHPLAGARYRKWSINSVGARGPEPVDGRARVLVLGASETFGLYESPGKEFPRQLEDSLHAAGCVVDVLNAGFPGMGVPTIRQDYLRRLAALRPTLVLYYPTPTQYLNDAVPMPVAPSATPIIAGEAPALRVVARLRDGVKATVPGPILHRLRARDLARARAEWPRDSVWVEVPLDRADALMRDLEALADDVTASGARLVVATHANGFMADPPLSPDWLTAWERFYPRATGSTLLAFEDLINARMREWQATRPAVGLVDVAATARHWDGPRTFADFSHFTDAGAARMAGALVGAVRELAGCRAADDAKQRE